MTTNVQAKDRLTAAPASRENSQQAYAKHRAAVLADLKLIAQLIPKYDAMHQKAPNNWAVVGSMEHIAQQLSSILRDGGEELHRF